MKRYEEEYRGYFIQRTKDNLYIYDNNRFLVKRIEDTNIYYAKIKIDELIAKNKRRKV